MLKPIRQAIRGEYFTIHSLACSSDEAFGLQQLGCFEGACGKVVAGSSNIILQIGETRLAISERLAKTIVIRSQ
jgi:Fe2+ transport system protein FeoA